MMALGSTIQVPYHDAFAFRVIREAYAIALEQKGSRKNPEVAEWLRYRREQEKRRHEQALEKISAKAPLADPEVEEGAGDEPMVTS
jgi:hypothetical protein